MCILASCQSVRSTDKLIGVIELESRLSYAHGPKWAGVRVMAREFRPASPAYELF